MDGHSATADLSGVRTYTGTITINSLRFGCFLNTRGLSNYFFDENDHVHFLGYSNPANVAWSRTSGGTNTTLFCDSGTVRCAWFTDNTYQDRFWITPSTLTLSNEFGALTTSSGKGTSYVRIKCIPYRVYRDSNTMGSPFIPYLDTGSRDYSDEGLVDLSSGWLSFKVKDGYISECKVSINGRVSLAQNTSFDCEIIDFSIARLSSATNNNGWLGKLIEVSSKPF